MELFVAFAVVICAIFGAGRLIRLIGLEGREISDFEGPPLASRGSERPS